MQLGLEGEQTVRSVLYVQDGATGCIPYLRPRKYPLSLEMQKKLRNNAYSCLPNKASLKNTKQNVPAIEPWHDYESSLYDLPKPCDHVATSRQPVHTHNTTLSVLELRENATSSMAFPEDLSNSFHCGQLDTSFNCAKIVNTSCFSEKKDPVSDISTLSGPKEIMNMVVPDCDDLSLDCDFGDLTETNTDSFYYTDKIKPPQMEKTRVGFNSPNSTHKSIVTGTQDLPLLFYPRSKRKRAFKATKQSKKPFYRS